MLPFAASSTPIPPPPRQSAVVHHRSTTNLRPIRLLRSHQPPKLTLLRNPKISLRRIVAYAGENGDGDVTSSGSNGGEEKVNNGRPRLNLRWVDLVLDPDPENIVAVGLTGLLTWASVQILWQLLVISLAILVAALKYSFIAALLIFILITLL